MFNRSKNLNLNTPYQKITNILWQNKRITTEKEKENVCLKTKLQFLSKIKNSKSEHEGIIQQLENKYQKFIQKVKEQNKWIKNTNQQIQERNYEQLKIDVMKIENKLNKLTNKALIAEDKIKKSYLRTYSKTSTQKYCPQQQRCNKSEEQLNELQKQKYELQKLLSYKQQQSIKIEQYNKSLNQQLIELLRIKNQLKNDLKECQFTNINTEQKQTINKPLVVTNSS